MHQEPVDFFISYNSADKAWAEWIASKLQPDYTVTLQSYDFDAGSNFVLEMQKAATVADRTIIVLSPAYLASAFTQPEWAAAFVDDPTGEKRKLVPVRVAACEPSGLLKALVYIDLVDKNEDAAAKELLSRLQPGRNKTLSAVPFPGQGTRTTAPKSRGRVPQQLWLPAPETQSVVRRSDILSRQSGSGASGTLVEVQLIPTDSLIIPTVQLRTLSDELARSARQTGLFNQAQPLDTQTTADAAWVRAREDRDFSESGLLITRHGQRGFWLSLPRDMLGSVLDPDELSPRMSQALKLVAGLGLEAPARYAVSGSMGPLDMVSVGSIEDVGRRSSSSMAGFGREDIVLPIEDSVDAAGISAHADDVAAEITARFLARFESR